MELPLNASAAVRVIAEDIEHSDITMPPAKSTRFWQRTWSSERSIPSASIAQSCRLVETTCAEYWRLIGFKLNRVLAFVT
jgi:hypothetical protein